MFKNKHMIVAMIVAPILALISYFATDYIVGEDPIKVEAGKTYPLVARSNCRYASGVCTLVNGDLEIKLSLEDSLDGSKIMQVYSNQKLDGVRIALAHDNEQMPVQNMMSANSDLTHWRSDLSSRTDSANALRIAMQTTGAVFYADVETDFFEHDSRYPEPIVN